MPMLLDTGRSRRGWSRIGDAFRCVQLHFFGDAPGGLNLVSGFETRDALIMGTLGHVGAAHLFRRMQAEQNGENPYQWYEPLDAIAEYGYRYPETLRHVDTMQRIVAAYMREYPAAPGRILSVEVEHVCVVGQRWDAATQKPEWGIWYLGTVDEVTEAQLHPGGPEWIWSPYVGHVLPYRLNVPGHEQHGMACYRTRRLDLDVETPQGVEDWDHKFKSHVGGRTADEYMMDGQFALARAITEQRYAWKAGVRNPSIKTRVRLNAIKRLGPFKVERPVMPQVEADRWFPTDLVELEERMMRYQVQGRNPWTMPRARHEQVCRSAYGTCAALPLCHKGPHALTIQAAKLQRA